MGWEGESCRDSIRSMEAVSGRHLVILGGVEDGGGFPTARVGGLRREREVLLRWVLQHGWRRGRSGATG